MALAIVHGHDDAHSWASAHARTSISTHAGGQALPSHRLASWQRPDVIPDTNSADEQTALRSPGLLPYNAHERHETSSVRPLETSAPRPLPDGERPRTPGTLPTQGTPPAARLRNRLDP